MYNVTDTIIKGLTYKVSRIHYRYHKGIYDDSQIKISSLNKDISRYNNQIKLFTTNDFIKEKTNDPCMIVFEEFDKVVVTKCRHVFCGDCHNIMSKNNKQYPCPECRTPVLPNEVIVTTMDNIKNENKKEEKEENSWWRCSH